MEKLAVEENTHIFIEFLMTDLQIEIDKSEDNFIFDPNLL